MKKVLLIMIFFFCLLIILIIYGPIHFLISGRVENSSDRQIQRALSHLNVKQNLILKNEAEYSQIKKIKNKESIYFNNDYLSVVKFYDDENGDYIAAGGCALRSEIYYYKIGNNYYPIDLNNTYLLRDPITAEDYLEIVRIEKRFNPTFCGSYNILTTKMYLFYPLDYSSLGCIPTLVDARARLEKRNEKHEFIYYIYYMELPSGLYESRNIFDIGEAKESGQMVYECEGGKTY